jgi:hypothetical protein
LRAIYRQFPPQTRIFSLVFHLEAKTPPSFPSAFATVDHIWSFSRERKLLANWLLCNASFQSKEDARAIFISPPRRSISIFATYEEFSPTFDIGFIDVINSIAQSRLDCMNFPIMLLNREWSGC